MAIQTAARDAGLFVYATEGKGANSFSIFKRTLLISVLCLHGLRWRTSCHSSSCQTVSFLHNPALHMQEEDIPELEKKIQSSFKIIANQFVDPAKAEENLVHLQKMKDNNIFKALSTLLNPSTTLSQAASVRVAKPFMLFCVPSCIEFHFLSLVGWWSRLSLFCVLVVYCMVLSGLG